MKLQLSLNKCRSVYYEDFSEPNYNQQREVDMQQAWSRLNYITTGCDWVLVCYINNNNTIDTYLWKSF